MPLFRSLLCEWFAVVAAVVLLPLVTALDFPTTIELDVVFPRNETYNSMRVMPMVFAIQNAQAAFQFGYTVTWSLNMGSSGQTVRQSSNDPVPPEAQNNIWYEYSNLTYFDDEQRIPAGTYNLSTRYIMGSCTDTPTTVNIGVTVLEASVEFTVVDDGSGTHVNLSSECPVFQDTVTVERLTGPVASTASCPVKTGTEPQGISNPCRAQMNEAVAKCVLNDLTGQYNLSTCAQAPPRSPNNDDDDDDDNSVPGSSTNTSTETNPSPSVTGHAPGATNTTTTTDTTTTTGSDSSPTAGSNTNMGVRHNSPAGGAAALTGFVVLGIIWWF